MILTNTALWSFNRIGDDFSVEDGIVGVFPNAIMKISMEDHQMKVDIAGDHPFIFEESLDCFEESENEN